MHLSDRARLAPDKPLVVGSGTGRVTTCANLDRRSNQVAHMLRNAGVRSGDTIGLLLENHPRLLEVQWGALRSGLCAVQLDPAMGESEIVRTCGNARVRALIASASLVSGTSCLHEGLPDCRIRLVVGGAAPGWQGYEGAMAVSSSAPLPDGTAGEVTYVWRDAPAESPSSVRLARGRGTASASHPAVRVLRDCGFDDQGVLLATTPLWRPESGALALAAHFLGGMVVVMEAFDAREALRLIERYRVTHGQWRTSAFIDLLDLPQPIRQSYDVLSMRRAVHSGAPLTTETRQAMLDWWGPILQALPGPLADPDDAEGGHGRQPSACTV